MKRNSWGALFAVVAFAISSAAWADEDRQEQGAVTISGVTYTFNTPSPIAGATVSIAEFPWISTVSDAQGRYSLRVPDEAQVTPFVSAPGYRTMHLQTFETDGEDISRVFAEMVPLQVYQFLAAVLGIDPNGPECNVVSTVSVHAFQGLSFEELVALVPSGEPGATVDARPALPSPIYFNAQGLPDPSLSATTIDGGVLFLNVPSGVHVLRATHPEHRFAKMKTTCAPGRFINASQPWGLWEKR